MMTSLALFRTSRSPALVRQVHQHDYFTFLHDHILQQRVTTLHQHSNADEPVESASKMGIISGHAQTKCNYPTSLRFKVELQTLRKHLLFNSHVHTLLCLIAFPFFFIYAHTHTLQSMPFLSLCLYIYANKIVLHFYNIPSYPLTNNISSHPSKCS